MTGVPLLLSGSVGVHQHIGQPIEDDLFQAQVTDPLVPIELTRSRHGSQREAGRRPMEVDAIITPDPEAGSRLTGRDDDAQETVE